MRLSIFNFESLRTVRPRFAWTAPAAIGVVLALEALVGALPVSWTRDHTGAIGRMETVESRILAQYDRPRVVVLGSSRAVFGVAPRLLDDALGLPPLSCVNASIIGGGPELIETFYRRNHEKIRSAELVLVNIDEWYFNDRSGGTTAAAAATPDDAVTHPPRPSLKETVGSRIVALRSALTLLRYNTLLELGLCDKPAWDVVVDENHQMWFADGTPEHHRVDQFQAVVRDYYRDFHIAPRLVEPLRNVARLVKAGGAQLVLMQMPNRPAYQAEVEALAGDEYRRQVRFLEELADELQVPFYNLDSAAACGMSDACWADGVHLKPTGAAKFTKFLGRLIREQNLLHDHETAARTASANRKT